MSHRRFLRPALRRVRVVLSALSVLLLAATVSSPAADTAVAAPGLNLLANPSFESGTHGWSGSNLVVVRAGNATAGPHAARVTRDRSDQIWLAATGTQRSAANDIYTASVAVGGNAPAKGKPVTLSIVERNSAGQQIRRSSVTATVDRTGWRTLRVTMTAPRNGDRLVVEVTRTAAAYGEVLWLDAASLTATPGPAPARVPGNLLHNPSFETGLQGWAGPSQQQVWLGTQIDGAHGARLLPSGSLLRIDNWPGDVTSSVAGATYTATIWVVGARTSVGKPVSLAVREHDATGEITSQTVTGTVSGGWRKMTVSFVAERNGDYVDMYLYQGKVAPTDVLYVDKASLTMTPPAVSSPPPTAPAPSDPPSTSSPPAPVVPPAGPVPPPAKAVQLGSTSGLLAIATDEQQRLGNTSRYDVVVLQDYMYAAIPAIKRANPATAVFTYFEGPVTRITTDCSGAQPEYVLHDSVPLNYCWVQANHPDWFLRASDGSLLRYSDFPDYALMDVGNPGYQAAWMSITTARAAADGFDGIYIDDISAVPHHGLDGRIATYTDQQYGAAVIRFMQAVTAHIHAAGLQTAANVGVDPWTPWQRTDGLAIAATLDLMMREYFSRYGYDCGPYDDRFSGSYDDGPSLSLMLSWYQQVQAAGTRLLGVDYGGNPSGPGDTATMTYGRALWLLAWDGKPGGAYMFHTCGGVPDQAAYPQWLADPGSPTSATQFTDGLWRRSFSGGQVLLNPSATASVTTTISGTWHDASGRTVTGTVTLAPTTALVLMAG